MKILLVDDVGVIRHSLSRVLEVQGFDVVAVSSGEEALRTIQADNSIQVVVTDLMMPGMSGIDLFQASRRIDRVDDSGKVDPPQFVLVTAAQRTRSDGTSTSILEHAEHLGFAAVIQKQHVRQDLPKVLNSIRQPGGKTSDPKQFERLLSQLRQSGDAISGSSPTAPQLSQYCDVLQEMLSVAEQACIAAM